MNKKLGTKRRKSLGRINQGAIQACLNENFVW